MKVMDIERTKSGIPTMWEKGGAYTNIGSAQIIGDHNGYPKVAVHVRTRGNLCCDEHAVIPVCSGDVVITADRHRDRIAISVYRIVNIGNSQAVVEPCTDHICYQAIQAAIAKATDYHCRRPHYIKNSYHKEVIEHPEDEEVEEPYYEDC